MGLALRAVSFRVDTAALMGVNTDRTISYTFMFGSALAGVAGVITAVQYQVDPLMGVVPGLKAFIAAVLGGMTSLPGAFVGGVLVGVVQSVATSAPIFENIPGTKSTFVLFVVLVGVLLVRPQGLFGKGS